MKKSPDSDLPEEMAILPSRSDLRGFIHGKSKFLDLEWEKQQIIQYVLAHPQKICYFTFSNGSCPDASFAGFPDRFIYDIPKLQQDNKVAFTARIESSGSNKGAKQAVHELKKRKEKYRLKDVQLLNDQSFYVLGIDKKAVASSINTAFGSDPSHIIICSSIFSDSKDPDLEVFEAMPLTEVGQKRAKGANQLFKENNNSPVLAQVVLEMPEGFSAAEKVWVRQIARQLAEKKAMFQKTMEILTLLKKELKMEMVDSPRLKNSTLAENVSRLLIQSGYDIGAGALQGVASQVANAINSSTKILQMQSAKQVFI